MTHSRHQRRSPVPPVALHSKPRQEQGIAMMITLMVGMLLLAAGTGLLSRMLMARKLGAAESYQQMAEAAALNGFNRILGTLNKNSETDYRGYLLSVDNAEPVNPPMPGPGRRSPSPLTQRLPWRNSAPAPAMACRHPLPTAGHAVSSRSPAAHHSATMVEGRFNFITA